MKGAITLFFLFCTALVFAQIDTVSQQLKVLTELYNRKKISLVEYQEMSNHLLRGSQAPAPQMQQQQNPQVKTAPEIWPAVIDSNNYLRTEEYCMLIATFKPYSTKVFVDVDFGQSQKFLAAGSSINKSGRLAYDNMTDALNFMNSKGWELYTAYPMGGYLGEAYHYLLKRKIVTK